MLDPGGGRASDGLSRMAASGFRSHRQSRAPRALGESFRLGFELTRRGAYEEEKADK